MSPRRKMVASIIVSCLGAVFCFGMAVRGTSALPLVDVFLGVFFIFLAAVGSWAEFYDAEKARLNREKRIARRRAKQFAYALTVARTRIMNDVHPWTPRIGGETMLDLGPVGPGSKIR